MSLFISLTSLCGGLLNTYGRFAVPAFTPVLLNLVLIAATLGLAPHMERPVLALAVGVFVAGVVQLAFQLPFLARLGLLVRPRLNLAHTGMRRVAVLVVPLMAAAALLSLPYLRSDTDLGGRWFLSERGRRTAVFAAVVGLVAAPIWVLFDEYVGVPGSSGIGAWQVALHVLPLAVLLAAVFGFHRIVRTRFGAASDESIQAVGVLLGVVFAILTLTGAVFRGAGMSLTWPWSS